jgi:hypothetical protein
MIVVMEAGHPRTSVTEVPRAASTRWVLGYVALAFAFSWAWWLPMMVAGQTSRAGDGWPTHLLGLTGPALAAIVITATTEGRPGLADLRQRALRWRLPLRWWLLVVATLALTGQGLR